MAGFKPPNNSILPNEGVGTLFGSSNLKPIDWRKKQNVNGKKINALTDVKSQGSCNSCWAFSAIQHIESILRIISAKQRNKKGKRK